MAERAEQEALAARLGVFALELTVESGTDLTPAFRRLRLTGPGLATLPALPGHDLMVSVDPTRPSLRRRYTIRRLDAAACAVDLHVALHGGGPGMEWAKSARPGDPVDAIGPRGKVTLDPEAEWHLFIGDDSFCPAALVMAEAVPADQLVLLALEVGDEADVVEHAIRADVTGPGWLFRKERAPGEDSPLPAALAALALPEGTGHAYVGGEFRVVAALRTQLLARGLAEERINAKPYWRKGRENAANGEPERS
ncbi:MAG TPA: siderophore-interacting protein [Acidimicrobiales bacterium]|nr:siderophore-interacting protein [Acidimicrobiales bacterium]